MLKQQMLKSQSKAKLYSRRYGTYCFTVDVLYPTVDESKMMFCNTVLMFSFQVVRIPMVEDRMPPDYRWRLSSATFKTLFMDHFSFPQLWRNCRNSKKRAGFYTLCIFLPGFFFDQNPCSCSPLYTFRWGRVGPQLVLSLLASSKRSRSPKSSGKRATPVPNIHPSLFCIRKMEELKLISTETLRDLIYEKFERMPDYPKTAEEEDPLAKVKRRLFVSFYDLDFLPQGNIQDLIRREILTW